MSGRKYGFSMTLFRTRISAPTPVASSSCRTPCSPKRMRPDRSCLRSRCTRQSPRSIVTMSMRTAVRRCCSPGCSSKPRSFSTGDPWPTGSSIRCFIRECDRAAGILELPGAGPLAGDAADRGRRVRDRLPCDACILFRAPYCLDTLRRRHPVSLKGMTLRALIETARHLELACRPLRTELAHLAQLRMPAILHWDMNHFVVLKSATRRGLVIHDPASGEKRLSFDEASKHLSGVAVELWPLAGFEAKDERTRLPLSAFFGRVRGTAHALAQIFALSVILEIGIIAAPFYMQLALDQVIASGDVDLLVVLAFGFGLVTALTVAGKTIRSLTSLNLQNTLHFAMGSRLFHHLVRLPLAYFEKRHIGDILSRFISLEPIRNVVAEGLITAIIDGLMGIATLTVVFLYSPVLGGVIVAAFLLYLILRLALYRQFRERSETVIRSKAQENSALIETLRAIQSLKLFNRETERESQWLNRYASVINAAVRIGRTKILFTTFNEAIFGLENIVTVYLAVRMTLSGQLTIGMIFAIMAYKQSFMSKAVSLVETVLDFRILELHLERLSDIALSTPEPGHDRPVGYARPVMGRIELRNVWFRY